MSDNIDLSALTRTSGFDPATLAVTPSTTNPASLSVAPPAFDPQNPLGLTAAAPGYLPPDQRLPTRDPDLGWSDGMMPYGTGGPGIPVSSLPVDVQNSITASEKNWADMDTAWAKTQLQSPTPLILGALGAIAAPFALSALGVGGALGGAAGAGAAGGGAAATGAGLAGAGAAGAGLAGAGALGAGAGATVSELVVTAAASGLSIPAIAAATGISAATVGSILANSGGSGTLQGSTGNDTVSSSGNSTPVDNTPSVEGVTVSPTAAPATSGLTALPLAVVPPAATFDATPGPSPDLTHIVNPPNPLATTNNYVPAAGIAGLTAAIASGSPSNVGDWVKANPVQAAALGLTIGGALGGSGTPSGGSYGIPTGQGAPGTPSSLNPIFSASLPGAPTAPRTQSALPQGIDWNRYAIQGPEQSFFDNVPQPGPAQFSVPSVAQIQQQGANNLGVADLAALRKKFAGPGFARGGRMDFAVHGAGDGRSDTIPAKLSDGEYVVDAETVSMLGNGSSGAGAKRLDRMRVNLRKAKGKQLARGRFSVAAKAPEHYMSGGRV